VIHFSVDQTKVEKESGCVLARYEIQSRSVYGGWPFARRPLEVPWFCLEFCLSIESWTDLEFAEPVPWLLVCHSPREPDVHSDEGYTDARGLGWLLTVPAILLRLRMLLRKRIQIVKTEGRSVNRF